MSVVFLRHNQSKVEQAIQQLMRESRFKAQWSPTTPNLFQGLAWLRIDVWGPLSKFPNTQRGKLQRAWLDKDSGKARSTTVRNPEYTMRLDALTRLWVSLRQKLKLPMIFKDAADMRLECVMLLGDSCSRTDEHNIPKAMCDWLQRDAKIVNNDANISAHARLKRRILPPDSDYSCSTILLAEEAIALPSVRMLVSSMLNPPGAKP